MHPCNHGDPRPVNTRRYGGWVGGVRALREHAGGFEQPAVPSSELLGLDTTESATTSRSFVKRGSPKKMVAVDPVMKYRTPSCSRISTTWRCKSECSMRQPPRRLANDPSLGPVSMLRPKMAHQHPTCRGVHFTGNAEPLCSCLLTKNLRHLVIDHLDLTNIQLHWNSMASANLWDHRRRNRNLHGIFGDAR